MMRTDLMNEAKDWMNGEYYFEESHKRIDSLIQKTAKMFEEDGDVFTDEELDHLTDWLWDRMNEYEQEEKAKRYDPETELDNFADYQYEMMRA